MLAVAFVDRFDIHGLKGATFRAGHRLVVITEV